MNRSPLAWDFVGPPPYVPVPRDDYLTHHHGDGLDVHSNHFERDFANDLELPDRALGSLQSQSQFQSPTPPAASAGSALSSDGIVDVAVSSGSDLFLDDVFDHDSIDYDSDSVSASANQLPSAAPSRSRPFSLSSLLSASASPSHSPSPSPILVGPDSASDLGADTILGLASGSDSDSVFDSDPGPASGPDPFPGAGFESDFDVDPGQDTDTGPVPDPEDPGSSPSSPNPPNPDPLLDRPRHHLQFNDINNDFFGRLWHSLPPRPARPARASLTPDIDPNRQLPDNHYHYHNYNNNNHRRHQALASTDSHSPRPIRHAAHPDNPTFPPFPPARASRRQPHLRSEPQPVSYPRPRSRNPHAALDGRHRHPQHPHHHTPSPQQATSVGAQGSPEQHEEDYRGINFPRRLEVQDHLLRERLRIRRARRAARVARVAREAERRPRPARVNWRPHRPARRTAVQGLPELESGQEDLDQSDSMDHDDELIELVYQRSVPAPPTPLRRQQRSSRPHRQHRHHHQGQGQGQDLMQVSLDLDVGLDQHVPVIDLTEEPDSPDLQRHRPINILRLNNHYHDHSHSHNQSHNRSQNHIHIFDDDEEEADNNDDIAPYQPSRNPRRHMSQNARMPSLNRSDGSILNGNAAAVIDLTLDSPDDNIPANRRLPPPPAAIGLNQPASRNHRRLPAQASQAPAAAAIPAHRPQYQNIGHQLIGSIRGLIPNLLAQAVHNPREADIQIVGALPVPPFPMNPNPLAGNPPEFNYQANGFGGYGGRQPTPKPDFQAPPPARPGFTRDTRPDGGDAGDAGADEELVVVCPSCDNELKYSPDDEDDSPRPAKKPRGKKSQEEHHFWAVKSCGHVYCKSCYDNRKKHSKGKDSAAAKTGFRFQPSETSKSIKIFCAVDDCESEVSPNAAWVGIFM